MKASTRSITLVLVGSILAGGAVGFIQASQVEDDPNGNGDWDQNRSHNGGGTVHRRSGFIPLPIFLGGGGGMGGNRGMGGAPGVAAPSARGGFGGTAAAHGGTAVS